MDLIEEMQIYAKEHDVPIMQFDGIDFMCNFIQTHHIQSILEIGSAIGYSAIRMAMMDEHIRVVTIERDDDRFHKAQEYVSRSAYADRIQLHHGDALEYVIDGEFDMIFIDAAKAQYIKFFERYEKNLKQGGYVISDNLKFHGFVEHIDQVKNRNTRQLVGKIARFVEYLKNRDDFETIFLDEGDGIGISQKK